MATLMATMFAAVKGAVGGGAAAAGAAGASAASTGFSLTSALSVASTVVGGLSAIYAGAQSASQLEQQAVDEETAAVQETLNGRQDALDALRALNDDQAAITAAGFASGIGGDGSVEAAQMEAQKIGERNQNMARDNAAISSAARRGQAGQLRSEAGAKRFGGIAQALKGGFSLAQSKYNRG